MWPQEILLLREQTLPHSISGDTQRLGGRTRRASSSFLQSGNRRHCQAETLSYPREGWRKVLEVRQRSRPLHNMDFSVWQPCWPLVPPLLEPTRTPFFSSCFRTTLKLRSDCATGNTASERASCLEETHRSASHRTQEPMEKPLTGKPAGQSLLTLTQLCP